MTAAKTLPTQFLEFEQFLNWALPSETQRRQKRESLSLEEIREFYDAVLPKAEAVFDYFRATESECGGAEKVGPETRLLFVLMLAFSEASLSVELHKSPIVPDGMHGDIWKPEHETPGWKNKPKIRLMPRSSVESPNKVA
ncbi:hypothetical protein [Glaciimonas sp. PCH181]|uniref:hypothetical protein n=1 Tax=Glaciimonas sp. PCH181 TaxID=2133943 RepID=UPI000D38C883|nr:hypothetical protein [Glaciimonas sp. PCH181]PUA19685.1 hypothetical protein C7W93_07580 [Glaciimonas sp. PCH181]